MTTPTSARTPKFATLTAAATLALFTAAPSASAQSDVERSAIDLSQLDLFIVQVTEQDREERITEQYRIMDIINHTPNLESKRVSKSNL